MKRWITIRESIGADGLGTPTISLYLAYCDIATVCPRVNGFCKECQNKHLQKDKVGTLLSIEEVLEITLPKVKFYQETFGECKIAFIGGEPLADINRQFVIELAKQYKENHIDTLLYTWRYIEDIIEENIDTSYFDTLVCGEYIEELNNGGILGSSNQYIYRMKEQERMGA
ncbi:MAG: 4Fe-4S cluster-binding domain-containing protein [Candidatus Woesearchaeota archaeon]|nr:4Fe-4S cluster-binding domain-containing protein [Candidatus Woesearchaeota archaeon]